MDKMKVGIVALAAVCAGAAFAKDFDPRAFGAKGDGKTKDTAAIQKAVDACSAAGGGEVRFAGGKFLTGMFFLKDGVTLRIDADATILGSPDYADYPTNVPLKHLVNEKCPRGRATALIVADECRNVGIVGRGRIDCNGDSFVELARTREYGYTSNGSQVGEEVPGGLGDDWVNWKYRRKPGNSPPRMVLFAGCADVLVEDVAIVNPAGGWGYWVTDCDRVVFDRAKVLANPVIPNNDGFHINCSRDVTIANCRVVAGDDGIKIRANSSALRHGRNRATERVVVSNCQIQSHAGSLSFCWLGDGVIRNCTFSNLVFTDSAAGISFSFPKFEKGMTDYGYEETLVENLSFDNIVLDRIYATPIAIGVSDDPMARFKGFRNVSFSNIRARALGFPSLRGRKSNPLENVVFSNCSFTKCAPESFPEKYQQKGAAYWFDPSKPQAFTGVKGVRFDGCTFEEE